MAPTVARTALRTAIPLRYPRQRERVLRILDRWARSTSYLTLTAAQALQAAARP